MEGSKRASPIRVLFLSDHFGYPHSVVHGATRYFLTVLPRLVQRGVDLRSLFLREEHPAAEQLKQQGIAVRFLNRAKWNPVTVIDTYRFIKAHRIQLVHCAGLKGIFTARVAGRLAGIPVIEHLHDSDPAPALMKRLLHGTRAWSAHTLAVSKDVADHAVKTLRCPADRVEVLHNGLVLDEYKSASDSAVKAFRERYGLLPHHRLIGCIGRLMPVKGQDTLLRAMPTILASQPDVRLMFIGDGPDRPALNQRVHELGLKGHVIFTGQLETITEALQALELVVMPSIREGLPYTLLEAMAAGKPVVASAVGGLAETIRHLDNGVLFRPGDAQALAHAVLGLLNDANLAHHIAEQARHTADAYDINRHVNRLMEIYHAVAEGHPIPPQDSNNPASSNRLVGGHTSDIAEPTESHQLQG